jgi:hypothetical protein
MKRLLITAFILFPVLSWAIPPSLSLDPSSNGQYIYNNNGAVGGATANAPGGPVAPASLANGFLRETSGSPSYQSPNSTWVYSAGAETGTITGSDAALVFATTSPTTGTLTAGQAYVLNGFVNLTGSGLTSTTQTAHCYYYKVGSAAIANSQANVLLGSLTTFTGNISSITLPTIQYTATGGETITIWCGLSAATQAGSVVSPATSGALAGAGISYMGMLQ